MTEQQAYLEYLKKAYPESAQAIQQGQNFLEAMVKIQTLPCISSDELGAVSEGIEQLAKEQES